MRRHGDLQRRPGVVCVRGEESGSGGNGTMRSVGLRSFLYTDRLLFRILIRSFPYTSNQARAHASFIRCQFDENVAICYLARNLCKSATPYISKYKMF
jgi:hypothetical protein